MASFLGGPDADSYDACGRFCLGLGIVFEIPRVPQTA